MPFRARRAWAARHDARPRAMPSESLRAKYARDALYDTAAQFTPCFMPSRRHRRVLSLAFDMLDFGAMGADASVASRFMSDAAGFSFAMYFGKPISPRSPRARHRICLEKLLGDDRPGARE